MPNQLLFGSFDDEVPVVDGSFPEALVLSVDRLEMLESAGLAQRDDDSVRIEVAGGWATYSITDENEDELALQLLDEELD